MFVSFGRRFLLPHLHEEQRLAWDGVAELRGVLGVVPSNRHDLPAQIGKLHQVGHFQLYNEI